MPVVTVVMITDVNITTVTTPRVRACPPLSAGVLPADNGAARQPVAALPAGPRSGRAPRLHSRPAARELGELDVEHRPRINEAERDGVTYLLTVCFKALRHLFAMHLLYSHTH